MKRENWLAGAAMGLAGGMAGALLGHFLVILAHQRAADPNQWLKGANGPPFFDLTMATALYYACLGAALFHGHRRVAGAGLGFLFVFLTLASPMALATRVFSWGRNPADPPTLAWYYLVLTTYGLSNLLTAAAIGGLSEPRVSWRRALGAAGGVAAAFLTESALRRFFPAMGREPEVIGYLAPPSALYSGAIWGACIGGGLSVAEAWKLTDGIRVKGLTAD